MGRHSYRECPVPHGPMHPAEQNLEEQAEAHDAKAQAKRSSPWRTMPELELTAQAARQFTFAPQGWSVVNHD